MSTIEQWLKDTAGRDDVKVVCLFRSRYNKKSIATTHYRTHVCRRPGRVVDSLELRS